ncbi:hypothetical protein [Bombilactobacillus bombi]|uniref:hypothetical protein n=1 Tax=Bombilactobacillus bombi TaxID=1303590 RepID=UPI0015E5ACAF|nr:hypothetical protein [Bombilactobacillus bombi]MBA1434942.1 hypothetical protein [Bombilactobacillus bombi]
MSTSIYIQDQQLIVIPRGFDKIWSLKQKLTFPLAHVLGATIDRGIWKDKKGVRNPGLGLPNKLAGTFVQQGERTFWNAVTKETPIVIQLKNEAFVRLVLSLPQTQARQVVDEINAQITNS